MLCPTKVAWEDDRSCDHVNIRKDDQIPACSVVRHV